MYFSNHRGWTDFFIDTYNMSFLCRAMTGGASYLARAAVIVAVPGASFLAYILGATFFFVRSPGLDRERFGDWMMGKMSER